MDAAAQPPDEVTSSIARCVAVLRDLDRLREALYPLRLSSDPRAQFATALFDLDRARRGDPEARAELLDVADRLLVFWREGNGVELSHVHPGLEALWASAATLLVSFEQKRFKTALAACWEARGTSHLLQEAIELLQPPGDRRAEFARCLYHLELARQFVDASRAEFARRAGLLSEAYQSEEVAAELIGDDQGLAHLWHDVKPYLDEFFEMMEEEAARRARRQALADAKAAAVTPTASPAFVPRGRAKTDPELMVDLSEPLGDTAQVPSFRSLMSRTTTGEQFQPSAIAPLPPAPGPSFDEVEVVEEVEVAPPRPPVDLTPPGSWLPSAEGDIEIVEAEEGPPLPPGPPPSRPPPPPVTPAQRARAVKRPPHLDIVLEEDDPDDATRAFWAFATRTLDLLPDPKHPRPVMRLLSVESRADRKKMNEYLDAAVPYQRVPDARAFSALIRLMQAGQLKEKTLFGQPNARRKEAFAQAFALLAPTPRPAAHGAVWFELDGPETLASLHRGLDVLTQFVTWCARQRRDPLEPQAQSDFLDGGL